MLSHFSKSLDMSFGLGFGSDMELMTYYHISFFLPLRNTAIRSVLMGRVEGFFNPTHHDQVKKNKNKT